MLNKKLLPDSTAVSENKITMTAPVLWSPDETTKKNANISRYMEWLAETRQLYFTDYESLHKWSVSHIADFWKSISAYCGVIFHQPYSEVVSNDPMPHTQWFRGSTLNYAEHIFSKATNQHPAIYFQSELCALTPISWQQLQNQTAALQSWFIRQGIQTGDRIAAYLPNIPEATIAMLATVATGAVWTSCSPDFGADSVIERLQQIAPRILIAADGYGYNGKIFDRREAVSAIKAALPSVEKLILVSYTGAAASGQASADTIQWADIMQADASPLFFEPVPFGHPIWVLYSSGTTGAPKAITHSHGGVLLEHLKYILFHNDVKPGENYFWFTTTGWMMWNYLNAVLLSGATIVLFDGNPGYPNLHTLWQLAAQLPIHHFGTSAPFLMACKKAGLEPMETYNLTALRSISSTGSPLPAEGFTYVYEKIKKDLWLISMSGGTDVCTAFVGGTILKPVTEGVIQCRALGCDMYAYDEAGNQLWDTVGEMVIAQPMPSMPVFFWNDAFGEKYFSSYFEIFPGVWSHGDWVTISTTGEVVISGRSDATLNRQGVRIGTAEIYRAVDKILAIKDSLIVNIELPQGGDYMPLFVVMQEGQSLTEEIIQSVKSILRKEYSPRHVPDKIIVVPDIPYTISGKKLELPVKKILMGKKVNTGAVRNPEALAYFEALQGDGY